MPDVADVPGMGSDRQQFRHASRWRSQLRVTGRLSAPDQTDTIAAILIPYVFDDPNRTPQDSYDNFALEGQELGARVLSAGKIPDIRFPATVDDFRDTLSNPRVSELIVCGLGNFSAVQVTRPHAKQLASLPSGRVDGMVDWYDLTMMSAYLPQGPFTARVCGRLNRSLNVPLGFVTADHRHIYSPVAESIYPVGLDHPDNRKIRQITDVENLEYEYIKKHFPRQAQRNGRVIDMVPRSAYFVMADTVHGLHDLRSRFIETAMQHMEDQDRTSVASKRPENERVGCIDGSL